MPPKSKKSIKPPPEPDLTAEPEFPISIQLTKIPKNRPIYRHAALQNIAQLKLLKTKLWRLHSLQIGHPIREAEVNAFQPSFAKGFGKIYSRLCSKTLAKSIRPIKRLDLNTSDEIAENEPFWRFRFRLESLKIRFHELTLDAAKALKGIIHNGVKSLQIGAEIPHPTKKSPWESHQILLKHFTRIERLEYWAKGLNLNGLGQKIKLPVCRSLKQVSLQGDSESKAYNMLKYWPAVEDLTLITDTPNTSFKFPPEASLKNLIKLDLQILRVAPLARLDFSPLRVCEQLACLALYINHENPQNLDSIIHGLPSLKELSFTRGKLMNPSINPEHQYSFEKLSLSVAQTMTAYNVEYFAALLSQTSNGLKALELSLPLEKLGEVLSVAPAFDLERLQLDIWAISPPYAGHLKKLVAFLKKQTGGLKELDLYFISSQNDLLEGVFKAISSKAPIEKLRVGLGSAVELQDRKITSIKDLVGRFLGLKDLVLDLERFHLDARDLTSFTGVFMKLKSLERFEFNVQLNHMTEGAFGKFLEFLKTVRHLKILKLYSGSLSISKEQKIELKKVIDPQGIFPPSDHVYRFHFRNTISNIKHIRFEEMLITSDTEKKLLNY